MDPVVMVCGAVIVVALLSVPIISLQVGSSLRGKAADEAEKRSNAEKTILLKDLSDAKALAENRAKQIEEIKLNIANNAKEIEKDAKKVKERSDIISNSTDPDDAALKLLRAAGNKDDSRNTSSIASTT